MRLEAGVPPASLSELSLGVGGRSLAPTELGLALVLWS